MRLELTPKVGAPPLNFGMSGDDARRVLGDPTAEYPLSWYYNDLQMNFDGDKMNFIQLSWSREGSRFDVWYGGVRVFDTPADELVRVISGELPTVESAQFIDRDLDLALWRPRLPSQRSPDEPDDEFRNGEYWQTIAIGTGDSYGHV